MVSGGCESADSQRAGGERRRRQFCARHRCASRVRSSPASGTIHAVLNRSQAISLYRREQGIDGPLFIGIDTHALSPPAFQSAMEVLAANRVELRIAKDGEPTPTPALSHATLVYNRGRKTGLADGVVVSPSHNPPEDGGFKYNPPSGGPADTTVTLWIEDQANALLEAGMKDVRRVSIEQALRAGTTHEHDFLQTYVADLGKVIDFDTIRGSAMIDRVAARLERTLYEVPVGFKWFVDGLLDGTLAFGGEESAGASFHRIDGTVWTTDKDGIIPSLLSAEITARIGRDPGELYSDLTRELGEPTADRVEAPATAEQKKRFAKLSPAEVQISELGGEKIDSILDRAPGNDAPIGGIKVIAASGWFAARPSGTEDIYKIYAESFRGAEHLRNLLDEAQVIVDRAVAIRS